MQHATACNTQHHNVHHIPHHRCDSADHLVLNDDPLSSSPISHQYILPGTCRPAVCRLPSSEVRGRLPTKTDKPTKIPKTHQKMTKKSNKRFLPHMLPSCVLQRKWRIEKNHLQLRQLPGINVTCLLRWRPVRSQGPRANAVG